MGSLTGGSGDPTAKQTETPSRQGGRKNFVQRLLRRDGPAELELAGPRDSTASTPKHSVIERLEGFFVHDLPSEMGNFPPPPEEPATRVADQQAMHSTPDIKAQPTSNEPDVNEENGGGVSSTYSAVRTIRTTAKEAIARSQEACEEIEAKLKGWAQELEKGRERLSESEAAAAVKLRELRAQATIDVAEHLRKGCQPVLDQSIEQLRQRSEAAVATLSSAAEKAAASLRELQEAIARSLAAEVDRAFHTALSGSSEQMQKQSDAVLAASREQVEKESQAAFTKLRQQLNESSDSVVAELQERLASEKKRFADEAGSELEKLRAARAPLIEEAQKQLADSVQPMLDGLGKAGVEKTRAELEALREKFVNESQSQVVSTFRASLDLLTKDVTKDIVERASVELAGARQTAVQETQGQLEKMSRESAERLQAKTNETLESATISLNASNQILVQKAHAQVAGVARDSVNGLLEAEIKNAVERGRQELGSMVDGFLAKAVPQIQVELEKLVSRHMESVRAKPELQSVARPPAPQIALVQNQSERVPALQPTAPQKPVERPSAPMAPPRFSVSPIEAAPSPAQRFSAAQIDPLAITTSQLARANMIEPPRVAPSPSSQPPGRTLDFRLAESAPKQHRIETRDLKAGIASGLKLGLALGAIALVIFGIYFFISPVIRLKANPPAAFFDANPSWTASQHAREDQLARLYWQVAVTQIEPKYAFGSTLPANAPDEFALAGAAASATVANGDAAARARYWEKLRAVWDQPESWERISKWDPESMRVTWNNMVSKVGGLFGSSNASPSTAP